MHQSLLWQWAQQHFISVNRSARCLHTVRCGFRKKEKRQKDTAGPPIKTILAHKCYINKRFETTFTPLVRNICKIPAKTDRAEGVVFCSLDSIRCRAYLIICVCCIMDVPPAVDPDPQTAAFISCLLLLSFFFPPLTSFFSVKQRSHMSLFSGSKSRSLVCPFFLPLFYSVSCPCYRRCLLGIVCRPESSQFALLVAHSGFVNPLDFPVSWERVRSVCCLADLC